MRTIHHMIFSALLLLSATITQAATDIDGSEIGDFDSIIKTYKPRLEKGEALAKAQCNACHGANVSSNVGQYPKLNGQQYEYMLKQLIAFKTDKRENLYMTMQLKTLSLKELINAAYYYSTLEPVTPGPHQNKAG